MAWVLTDESCNINFLQDGSTHRTIPKEQIALEIVLAGEVLNDTTVDCVFVRYEGKYAIELPYNDTTVGVSTYASAELLRAAIVALCNTNPCAGGGSGVDEFSELTDAYDLATAKENSVPMNFSGTLAPVVLFDSDPITVNAATTAALSGTYTYNNLGGIGDTLTRTTNGAFQTVDGVAAALNNRYLIKNYTGANRIRNGVWVLTQVGTAGTPAILTRATDSDETSELNGQIVIPSAGTSNGRRVFSQTASNPTVGTTPINYAVGAASGGNIYSDGRTDFTATQTWDDGSGVTVAISPANIIHTDGGVTITTDPTTGGIAIASGTNLGSYGSANANWSDGTNSTTAAAGSVTISDGTNTTTATPTGFSLNNGTHSSDIKAIKVSMNTAAVKTLNSLPVVAVSAPGAGYAIEIISASARNNFNTTPFDAGNRLFLEIGLSGSSQMQAASFLENTVSAITRLTYVASAMDVSNLVENQALKITSNADSVGGDGSVDVYINYRIIQL